MNCREAAKTCENATKCSHLPRFAGERLVFAIQAAISVCGDYAMTARRRIKRHQTVRLLRSLLVENPGRIGERGAARFRVENMGDILGR
jgi:hypothetical protein